MHGLQSVWQWLDGLDFPRMQRSRQKQESVVTETVMNILQLIIMFRIFRLMYSKNENEIIKNPGFHRRLLNGLKGYYNLEVSEL